MHISSRCALSLGDERQQASHLSFSAPHLCLSHLIGTLC